MRNISPSSGSVRPRFAQVYRQAYDQLAAQEPEPMPPGLEKKFGQFRKIYWDARIKYSDYLCGTIPSCGGC